MHQTAQGVSSKTADQSVNSTVTTNNSTITTDNSTITTDNSTITTDNSTITTDNLSTAESLKTKDDEPFNYDEWVNDNDKESFTGWYDGGGPQFGLGAGMEAGSEDKDFALESLSAKMSVMPDRGLNHRPQIPPDNIDDVVRSQDRDYGVARMTAYTNHYMDVSEKNAFMAQTRARNKRALDGAVLANAEHFKFYFGDEFSDAEKSRWWGNRDYEPTITYGELHYSK